MKYTTPALKYAATCRGSVKIHLFQHYKHITFNFLHHLIYCQVALNQMLWNSIPFEWRKTDGLCSRVKRKRADTHTEQTLHDFWKTKCTVNWIVQYTHLNRDAVCLVFASADRKRLLGVYWVAAVSTRALGQMSYHKLQNQSTFHAAIWRLCLFNSIQFYRSFDVLKLKIHRNILLRCCNLKHAVRLQRRTIKIIKWLRLLIHFTKMCHVPHTFASLTTFI